MHRSTRWHRTAAVIGAVAVLAAACGSGDSASPEPTTPTAPSEPAGIVFDVGVTAEPCPEAIDPDNGCIYLGILSDLTVGPFAGLGPEIVRGQQDFWTRVNEEGGIAGFEIDVFSDSLIKDTKYDKALHEEAYRELRGSVLALAQTLGTEQTQAIIDLMDADDVIAGPAGWWSGFHFEEESKGLILPSGYSYCLESMIGLDWWTETAQAPNKIAVVGFPGDFGGDVAAGAELWAAANDVEFHSFIRTGPTASVGGNQDAAVGAVIAAAAEGVDLVLLGVGPQETAEIVGKVGALTQGAVRFLGAGPTWAPALLGSPSAPALVGLFRHVAPWEDWTGPSAGHAAMAAKIGDNRPRTQAYAAGWVWQYPLKAAIEAAAANGDLTRAGLRSVVDGLEVDYEGVLPTGRLGGDPNVNVNRTAVIGQPNPESLNGLTTVADGYRGVTADNYEYRMACSG